MDYKHQSYKEMKIPSTSAPDIIRSGNASLRERGTFSGTSWKPKQLELSSQALTIVNLSSKKRTRIELRDITELERTDLADHALGLRAKGKRYNISFNTDSELYDWQDDIYQRCPLGGYSAPFDFVHKSHIGSDNVAGTFAETNILPIYAEIIGGQPAVSKSPPPIAVVPRSRPASSVPLGAVARATSSSPPSGSRILEGLYTVKHSGLFAGWLWKERWLSLTPQALIIHRRSNNKSPPSKSISLSSLTRVEPDEKRDGCLIVEFALEQNPASSISAPSTDTVAILFKGYSDLYTWRDAIYQRSALSSIGNPTNFMHKVHVGFDPATGRFRGLPGDWQAVQPSSSLSGDKQARRQSRRKSAPLEPPVNTA